MSIWKSVKGLFGQTIHYKDGVKVGETWDGFIPGTKKHYDANGNYAGYSSKGFFADEVHHDRTGARVGESWNGAFGMTHHYDNRGHAGTSCDGLIGRNTDVDDFGRNDYIFDSDSGSDFSDW